MVLSSRIFLYDLERAQQFVETRVPASTLRCRCASTSASPSPLMLLGVLVGHREDLFALPVGFGANAQRLLLTFGAILPRDALALGAHARIDALLVLLRADSGA